MFNEIFKRVKFTGTQNQLVVIRVLGKEEMGNYCLMFTEVLSGVMKKFWKHMLMMTAKHYECIMPLNFAFKNYGPVVKNLPSNAGNMGSIPVWGAKIATKELQLEKLECTITREKADTLQ